MHPASTLPFTPSPGTTAISEPLEPDDREAGVTIHGAPVGLMAGREVRRAHESANRVSQLRADLARYRRGRDEAQARQRQMEEHDRWAHEFERSAPYNYDGLSTWGSALIGSMVGALAGAVCSGIFAVPAWTLGATTPAGGVIGAAIVTGRKLSARCDRDFHARHAGSVADRSRVVAEVHNLAGQVRETKAKLEAAVRVEAIDEASHHCMPLPLLQLIGDYDRGGQSPDPGASAPASAPQSPAPEPAHLA